jgi:hypothetical protein
MGPSILGEAQMLTILEILFLILALICFALAARLYPSPKLNLEALGLFFITLFFLVPLLVSLSSGPHRSLLR